MKRLISYVLILLLAASLCGCSGGAYETGGDGLSIVTTVFPAFDFAREIAGEQGNVCLLVPPGSESHSFEPTAQDIQRIGSCDLLICNGGESEAWLEEILEGAEGDINVLSMLDCVTALEEETKEGMQVAGHDHDHEHHEDEGDEHEHHEHEEIEYDEHVWTSPVNAQLICRAICEKLCEADSANAAVYRKRLEEYTAELAALDREFRAVTENAPHKTVIFADRFPVRYFTEEYGLDYYAAFPGCADDAEPSARTVAFLIDKVREEQCPAVFYIEFSNQKMADVICEDTRCGKLLFHSCHNVSRDELVSGVSYLTLMRSNVDSLREALG